MNRCRIGCRLRVRAGAPAKSVPGALLLAALLLPALPVRAGAVLVVLASDAAPYRQAEAALKADLAKRGHTTQSTGLADLAKNAQSIPRADAYAAIGTKAAVWLKGHLKPQDKHFHCMVSDPDALGQTTGCHACGVGTNIPFAEQFRLIAEALPNTTSVGVLYQSKADGSRKLLKAIEADLPKGWQLQAVAIDKYESVAKAIDDLLARNVGIVWTLPDASVYNVATVRSLLLAALRRRTPVFGFSPAFVRAGALLGVGIDPDAQGRQAAAVAQLLLEGAVHDGMGKDGKTVAKSDLHPAPQYQVAVNLIVAAKLAIDLPEKLVRRAAFVFRDEQERGK